MNGTLGCPIGGAWSIWRLARLARFILTLDQAMPKLYEYLGIVVLFYSNEHEPVHVHGRRQGRESRAELTLENGRVVQISYTTVRGRRPLSPSELKDF